MCALKKNRLQEAQRGGTVPNPPIQPQTEGGNILTALRWRGESGGLEMGRKKGKNKKRGREIATEGEIGIEEEEGEADEEVESEHKLLRIKTKLNVIICWILIFKKRLATPHLCDIMRSRMKFYFVHFFISVWAKTSVTQKLMFLSSGSATYIVHWLFIMTVDVYIMIHSKGLNGATLQFLWHLLTFDVILYQRNNSRKKLTIRFV